MLQLHTLDIDTLPINVAIYKKEGNDFIFQDFNTQAEKTENIRREALLNKKLTEVFPAVKEFGLFDVLKRVAESGKSELLDAGFYQDERIQGWRRNHVVKLTEGTVAAFYEDCSIEKQKEQEHSELKTSLQYQKKVFEHIMDDSTAISIQGYDEHHNVIYWNKGSELLYGYSKEEALGKHLEALIIPDTMKQHVSSLIDNWLEEGTPIPSSEVVLIDKDGNDVHVLSHHVMIQLDEDHYEMYCIDIDLSNIDALKEKLHTQENLLQTIMNLIPDLVWMKDLEGKYMACNTAVERFSGHTKAEILGKTDFDFFEEEVAQSFQKNDQIAIKLDGYHINEETLHSADGSKEGYFETIKTPMKDAKGELIGVVGIARDITERKEREKTLQLSANYDHLTGLANRLLFLNRMKHLLNHRESTQQYHALLFIDLDAFKNINDTQGHDTGDLILKKVSKVLQKFVRKEDTVARIGGDEFTILLENISSPYDAGMIAQKIIDAMQKSIFIKNKHFYISASIGIAISPDDTFSADSLLSYADTAMYHAKATGKNNYKFYKKDFSYQSFEKLLVENDLRHALENDEFLLYYQPQVILETKQSIGLEALLRWNHPQKGIIEPIEFMKIAETSGQFNAIGIWIMKQAMTDMVQWKKMKIDIETISINLSIRQLEDETLVSTLEQLLKETECHPEWIEFEIPEKYITMDNKTISKKLNDIHQLACKISIENFGMGYTSLTGLQHLPIHKVVLHRTLIHSIGVEEEKEITISTLILIAKQFKLGIIAKCIENKNQEKFLIENDCHLGQGFLYTKPMPKEELQTNVKLFDVSTL